MIEKQYQQELSTQEKQSTHSVSVLIKRYSSPIIIYLVKNKQFIQIFPKYHNHSRGCTPPHPSSEEYLRIQEEEHDHPPCNS